MLGSSDPQAARNTAAKLSAAYPKSSLTMLLDRPFINASTFEKWGRQESAPLAVSVAYDGGKLLNYKKVDGAYQMTQEYITNSKVTADRQAALAGYRIAEALAKLLGDPPATTTKPEAH